MRIIHNDNLTPQINLATEEYLIGNSSEDIFMLWRNSPSIIIGRNQNTMMEINYPYVKENNINVVRRMSGGGAVFHDLGNVNYTFITDYKKGMRMDFGRYAQPIIDALGDLGVKAKIGGRNDIVVNEKKICGNSQYMLRDRLMHHGCILFSSKLDNLKEALRVDPEKLKGKGVSSIRSRVTNIIDHLKNKMDVTEFISYLEDYILKHSKDARITDLSENEQESIKKIADSKYASWDWNYGKSQDYNFRNQDRFNTGSVEVVMNVESGVINSCRIFGDFFNINPVSELEEMFVGQRHELSCISELINRTDVDKYIVGISKDELLSLLF